MPRKPTKGYFVRGHFVAAGSELDQELKRELKGDVELSKTDLKKHSDHLQALGEQLLELRAGLKKKLDLPERLLEAVEEARRISNFEGRRRQMQYIGKLMRKLDEGTVAAIEAALLEQHQGSAQDTLRLHRAEHWRDRLVAEDVALTEWLETYPTTDPQHLRTLIRQARKDAAPKEVPGEAPRHGKSYREIFQLVQATLKAAETPAEQASTEAADEGPAAAP